MRLSQRRDYFWNTVGVFTQNAISPLLLIAVTRINGVYDSGVFSFAFATALIFGIIAVWGGRTYQVSDLKQEFSYHSYVLVRLITGVLVLVGSVIFCFVNGYDFTKTAIILLFVVFKIAESIADVLYGVLQVKGKLFESGISLFAKAALGALAFILTDLVTNSLIWSTVSLISINILIFISYDLSRARKVGYRVPMMMGALEKHISEAVVIIKRCAPIAAVLLLTMFSLNIPRYFLDIHHPSEVGYFGIIAMPITVLALVITFLLQPKIVLLTELFSNQNYDELGHTIRGIIMLILLVGLTGIVTVYYIGIPTLDIIFGLRFEPYLSALIILMVGAMANGIVSIYVNIFTIIRHFKAVFYTLVITNILLTVMSIKVIEQHSIIGAVSLFTIINFVQTIILITAYKRVIRSIKTDDPKATVA